MSDEEFLLELGYLYFCPLWIQYSTGDVLNLNLEADVAQLSKLRQNYSKRNMNGKQR